MNKKLMLLIPILMISILSPAISAIESTINIDDSLYTDEKTVLLNEEFIIKQHEIATVEDRRLQIGLQYTFPEEWDCVGDKDCTEYPVTFDIANGLSRLTTGAEYYPNKTSGLQTTGYTIELLDLQFFEEEPYNQVTLLVTKNRLEDIEITINEPFTLLPSQKAIFDNIIFEYYGYYSGDIALDVLQDNNGQSINKCFSALGLDPDCSQDIETRGSTQYYKVICLDHENYENLCLYGTKFEKHTIESLKENYYATLNEYKTIFILEGNEKEEEEEEEEEEEIIEENTEQEEQQEPSEDTSTENEETAEDTTDNNPNTETNTDEDNGIISDVKDNQKQTNIFTIIINWIKNIFN